jgi:hypothetical protein
MKIVIGNEFKNDFTTRVAGERLRKMIVQSTDKVVLDFVNVKIASASFFDEGIAKLGEEGWNSKKIKETVSFENIFKKDMELLRSVCLGRNIEI